MVQALQPVQELRSIDIPHLCCLYSHCGNSERSFANALLFRTGEFRVLVKFGVSGGAERIALLHGLGVLSVGEFVAARFPRDAGARALPKRAGRSQGVSIESNTVGDFSGASAPVAEMNGQGFIGLSGHNPYRTIHLAALELDLHHVAGGDPIVLRALRGNPDCVVPGHLVLRLRHLLKPRIVGHRSVADGRIGAEYDFKPRGCAGSKGRDCRRVDGFRSGRKSFRERPFPP